MRFRSVLRRQRLRFEAVFSKEGGGVDHLPTPLFEFSLETIALGAGEGCPIRVEIQSVTAEGNLKGEDGGCAGPPPTASKVTELCVCVPDRTSNMSILGTNVKEEYLTVY